MGASIIVRISQVVLEDLKQAKNLNEVLKKASFTLTAKETVETADALGWIALLIQQIGAKYQEEQVKPQDSLQPQHGGLKVMDYKVGELPLDSKKKK